MRSREDTAPDSRRRRASANGDGSPRGVAYNRGFVLTGPSTPPLQLLHEIWDARPVIGMLARKQFYVKYRRVTFGMLWAVGLPLFQAAVLAVVFTRFVRIGSTERYPPFIFAGMVGWSFLTSVVGVASTSIVDSTGMSNRIYFPRAVPVIANVATNMYGFSISLVIAFLVCAVFGTDFGWQLLLLVPAIVLAASLALVFSLFNSAVHVYFRDVRQIVAATLTAWFYVTPVIYPLSRVPDDIRWLVRLNPASGVVQLFRESLLGADPSALGHDPRWVQSALVTCAWIAVVGAVGLFLHCRLNRNFVDRL